MQLETILGQGMSQYQWKNRLVIILTNEEDNQLYTSQLNDLKTVVSGLEERKILVITLTPDYQITGIDSEVRHEEALSYSKLKKENDAFEILLIGLDGYTKLQQSSLLTHQELFAVIDRMPMRRSEIEKN